jgi:FkbM family methyltransferase
MSALDPSGALDDGSLLRLAAQLAWCRPLGRYPGWHFDKEWDNPALAYRLRRALWLEARDRRLEEAFVFDWYDDLRVHCRLGNDVSKQLYVGGCFDPNEFAFLAEVLRPGMTFVDVGANEGLYATFAAARVGPRGRVWAFEPSPRERERLRANLDLNPADNVRVFETALGAHEGTAALSVAGYGHEGQNTLGAFVYEVELETTVQVGVARLDTLARSHGLDRCDVLKIDAEGADCAVLEGSGALLAALRPTVLFEANEAALGNHGSSLDATLGLLAEAGFDAFAFGAETGVLEPYTDSAQGPNLVAIPRGR